MPETIYLSGDRKQTFADIMNQKARAIGMTATRLVTSNGLHDPNHYSTARDMAKLATSLERPDTKLIVVVMHSLNGQTRFRDTKELLYWATKERINHFIHLIHLGKLPFVYPK